MKNIFFLILFTFSSLFSYSSKVSPIPLPKKYFINLENFSCNSICLEKLLENEQYYSFLSLYNKENSNNDLLLNYNNLLSWSGENEEIGADVKLAILLPQKNIHKYAITTVNAVYAYLLHKKSNFIVEVFNSVDESPSSLQKALNEIRAKEYRYVIAPLTNEGVDYIMQRANGLLVYVPTIHKSYFNNAPNNILFGGIDYDAQIKELLKYSNNKIVIFSDPSKLSSQLQLFVQENSPYITYENTIEGNKLNLKPILNNNHKLDNASIFINMSIVKSSLLASQLRVYDIEPFSILSTQINYNPILLTLTQHQDREKLYLANSIDVSPSNLRIINKLLGNDIEYNWVNYAVGTGLDYLYTNFIKPEEPPIFQETLIDGQIIYKINIIKTSKYKFYSTVLKQE